MANAGKYALRAFEFDIRPTAVFTF